MKIRSQSAMEYLMTYGWAILIIAVILGVLFSLGVFNPTNYAPRVPAGNCHVFRPNGPGTNFNVNLVGTCSGFLPQYVAQFNGQSNSNVSISYNPTLNPPTSITVSEWIYTPMQSNELEPVHNSNNYYAGWKFITSGNLMYFEVGVTGQLLGTFADYSSYVGSWHQYAGTYDGSNIKIYIDGALERSTAGSNAINYSTDATILIGGSAQSVDPYAEANLQVYNTSLDANEIQYLYNEGIGGAPIYLSHLVGWWPLNGDVKDYSGNGNDGTPYNVAFNGSWTTGYSQP